MAQTFVFIQSGWTELNNQKKDKIKRKKEVRREGGPEDSSVAIKIGSVKLQVIRSTTFHEI